MTRECYNVLYKKWGRIETMKNLHCIPNLNEIEEYLSLCAEYGMVFEYNEFFSPDLLTDPEAYEKAEKAYLALERNRADDTLHGAFYDINIASDDPDIRKITDKRIRAGMESARKFGARGVIFHTNYIANFTLKSYRDAWVKRCAAYYRQLAADYPDVEVYVENMFDEDPELLARLCEALKDVKNFGACFDFAHAYVSVTCIEDWLDMIGPYIKHIHINDNYGSEDLHLPVGEGTLPWKLYDSFMRSFPEGKAPSVLIEVSATEKLKKSLKYMKENKIYPF